MQKTAEPSVVTLGRIDPSINFQGKYHLVPGFERDFSRHILEIWSILYRYGTLVIRIKRQYWPDSQWKNVGQHRARYPKNFFETRTMLLFSQKYHI